MKRTMYMNLPSRILTFMLFLGIVSGVGGAGEESNSNAPPSLSLSTERSTIQNESIPIGTRLLTLQAFDIDGPELIFKLKPGDMRTELMVDLGTPVLTTTGTRIDGHVDVYLKSELDFETSGGTETFQFIISDSAIERLFAFSVYLIDVNDNSPRFFNSPYRTRVREDQTRGKVIYSQITATDADTGSIISYSIATTDSRYNNTFSIGKYNGNITLEEALDYEMINIYQYTVTAYDGRGRNSSTELFITIQDIQDTSPRFFNQPYVKTITEDATVGSPVLTVSAADGDRGVPMNLRFALIEQPDKPYNSWFRIDETTGEISVAQLIDTDTNEFQNQGSVLELRVQAVEIGSSDPELSRHSADTTVTITVQDVNDNAPLFGNPSYTASVQESLSGVPIMLVSPGPQSIFIRDADQSPNNRFSVTLMKDNQPFDILYPTPATTVSSGDILIRVNTPLDFETLGQNPLIFQIVAREIGTSELYSSTATVTLSVENVNDNIPAFYNATYKADVKENSVIGTPVTQIQATDGDQGAFGQVTYSIIGSQTSFGIYPENGTVFVAGMIDRETRPTYYLTIEARDSEGLRDLTQLIITVIDVNDMPPEFQRSSYSGVIRENSWNFVRSVVVQAIDKDSSNLASTVNYRIVSAIPASMQDNFTMDATQGSINITSELDYESLPENHPSIQLLVEAYDLGSTVRMTSRVNVTITVEDENDVSPVFSSSSYHVELYESVVENDLVIIVNATDGDGTFPNNAISYRIVSGADFKFRVEPRSGKVYVESGDGFDRDVKSVYILNLTATDRGSPDPLQGMATLTVTILDVNNKPPFFRQAIQMKNLLENASISTSVLTFVADDPDNNNDLTYSLLRNQTEAVDVHGNAVNVSVSGIVENYFSVHRSTGEISVQSMLDRETAERITLYVLVRDLNATSDSAEKQTATGTLTITLLDVNDNSPVFGEPRYMANVSEGTRVQDQFTLITVQATDPDQYSVSYRIEDLSDKFKIDSSGGQVSIKSTLDREVVSVYKFVVWATDAGDPQQSSSVSVTITVLDENDESPVFSVSSLTIHVPEDKGIGSLITNIAATDKDLGLFKEMEYTITSGNSDLKFSINITTGDLFVKGPLNREDTASYTLMIRAEDYPQARQGEGRNDASVSLKIIITDANDNAPEFQNRTIYIHTHILETVRINDVVDTIRATDADDGDNKRITYTISEATGQNNITGRFKINPSSGVIQVAQSLRGYYGAYFFTVVATDHGNPQMSSSAAVVVIIRDFNSNAPYFYQPPSGAFRVFVRESPDLVEIYTVFANDSDRGDNGRVKYRLQRANTLFTIDEVTGVIKNTRALDYEEQSIYTLYIIAEDRANPPLPTETSLIIQVLDENDNPPVFNVRSVVMPMNEEMSPGVIGTIDQASDEDSGNNSVICYCLLGPGAGFEINAITGAISTTGRIDREGLGVETNFTLTVKVIENCQLCDDYRNSAYDKSDHSQLLVYIVVNDINDNPPRFRTSSTINVGITRDTQSGEEITQLSDFVTDRDIGENARHTYTVISIDTPSQTLRQQLGTQLREAFVVESGGLVKTNIYFRAQLSGRFRLDFLVRDAAGNATGRLMISLINDDQRLKIVFYGTPEEIALIKADIAETFSNATGYRVVVDKLQTHEQEDGSADPFKTDMFIHGEDRQTDGVVDAATLLSKIDSNIKFLHDVYKKNNIIRVMPTTKQEIDDPVKSLRLALILVAIILGLFSLVMVLIFISCRKIYRRKLKAANATMFGHKDTDMQKLQIPGTNQYATDASNPIWMETYDNAITAKELDTASQNSLDDNAIEPTAPVNRYDEQEVSLDLRDDYENFNKIPNVNPSDIYLSAALQEHEASKQRPNKDLSNFDTQPNVYTIEDQPDNNNLSKTDLKNDVNYADRIRTSNINGLQTTEI